MSPEQIAVCLERALHADTRDALPVPSLVSKGSSCDASPVGVKRSTDYPQILPGEGVSLPGP